MKVRLAVLTYMLALSSAGTSAQTSIPPVTARTADVMQQIVALPTIKSALAAMQRDDELTLKEQIELNEIEAPPFKEQRHAADFLRRLRALGISDARIDSEGNVIGTRRGSGKGPRLVVSAHLDTVFRKEPMSK